MAYRITDQVRIDEFYRLFEIADAAMGGRNGDRDNPTLGLFKDLYTFIKEETTLMVPGPSGFETAENGVDFRSWLWIGGAAKVNNVEGFNGVFIQEFTKEQSKQRTGELPSDDDAQVALNLVVHESGSGQNKFALLNSKFARMLQAFCISLLLPTVAVAEHNSHGCPDDRDSYEIVDFGKRITNGAGEKVWTFGGVLFRVGPVKERRLDPDKVMSGIWVNCVAQKYIGDRKQFYRGKQVPLAVVVGFRGSDLRFWEIENRSNGSAFPTPEAYYERAIKSGERAALKGPNYTCLYEHKNTGQKADGGWRDGKYGGYRCVAVIEGLDISSTRFSCHFDCHARLLFTNGLSFGIDIGSFPKFLDGAETIPEAVAAWEAQLLEIHDDILGRIVERTDEFEVRVTE